MNTIKHEPCWHVRRPDTGDSLMIRAVDRMKALLTGAELLATRTDKITIVKMEEWG
jgi:hypothetical protein